MMAYILNSRWSNQTKIYEYILSFDESLIVVKKLKKTKNANYAYTDIYFTTRFRIFYWFLLKMKFDSVHRDR